MTVTREDELARQERRARRRDIALMWAAYLISSAIIGGIGWLFGQAS